MPSETDVAPWCYEWIGIGMVGPLSRGMLLLTMMNYSTVILYYSFPDE